jgi:hypothetical protein
MGWKTINGRSYYYKSRREGGQVKTDYCGAGAPGLLMSLLVAEDQAEREAIRAERAESLAEDRAVAEWFDGIQAIADAAIIAAGFHKHKGQWRRKRP